MIHHNSVTDDQGSIPGKEEIPIFTTIYRIAVTYQNSYSMDSKDPFLLMDKTGQRLQLTINL